MRRVVKQIGKAGIKPPKSELGYPKKNFNQTFSAVTALKEHFKL